MFLGGAMLFMYTGEYTHFKRNEESLYCIRFFCIVVAPVEYIQSPGVGCKCSLIHSLTLFCRDSDFNTQMCYWTRGYLMFNYAFCT